MLALTNSDGVLTFSDGVRLLRLAFVSAGIVRVTYTEGREFCAKPSLIVTATGSFHGYAVTEADGRYRVSTAELVVAVDKQTAALAYYNAAGNLLLQEPARGGKHLTPRAVHRNRFVRDEALAFAQQSSIDGARAEAAIAGTVFDRNAFEARVDFVFQSDEALFGLGSHEEGYGNLRGRSRELYQQNMKAVVPVLVSTKGWGLLLDCGSLMTFHDDALGSYWWADCVDELDFYFVAGGTYDDVTAGLRTLTGPVPLPPRWMFGFVQSKERYVNAEELLAVVREYRRRDIPLDTIVLDWKSWPNGAGWGQKSFDPVRFPDAAALTTELHSIGAHLMVSVWPIMTGGCADQRELLAANAMLGNQSTYDAFSADARELYWKQAERGLMAQGVDAWWCDCTEPFEADWAGAVKPEPHARLLLNTAQSKRYLDPGSINAYSLEHSRGMYEGQRAASDKRVVNLTRSSYAGQSRYGTITWNGDISATWETLRRCIPEGLNFVATGEPYWTTDIGGFFVRHDPSLWFWRGDYDGGTRGLTPGDALEPDPADTGSTDLGFHELYVRWLQYAVFLPMCRSHGTDVAREIWRFGEPGNRFYDAIASFLRLRSQLVPYLYSLAADVTFHGRAMLRAVALEFPADMHTHGLTDQFLLGPSLLVCPVTKPMYYGPGSSTLQGKEQRDVYLPEGCEWFDFWSDALFDGGQSIAAAAPMEQIPLYIPAGSILPLGPVSQYVDEDPAATLSLHVYPGRDVVWGWYEDAGDGYQYESGAFCVVLCSWSEAERTFTAAGRIGSFPGLVIERTLEVVVHGALGWTRAVRYSGQKLEVRENA